MRWSAIIIEILLWFVLTLITHNFIWMSGLKSVFQHNNELVLPHITRAFQKILSLLPHITRAFQKIWSLSDHISRALQKIWSLSDHISKALQKIQSLLTHISRAFQKIWSLITYISRTLQKIWSLSLQIIIRNSNYHISSLVGLTISECLLYDVPQGSELFFSLLEV